MKQNRYKKPDSVKQLEALAMQDARDRHPAVPEHVLCPRLYRDDTANSLTKCVVDYIRLQGYFASRVNNTGVYRPKLGRYIPGQSRKGLQHA